MTTQPVQTPAPLEADASRLLPQLLRGAGALALAAAVLGLLFRNWSEGSDLYRYLMLLGFTVGMALIGFVSGRVIGDGKGARLLVTAALAAIPANFAILGAFFHRLWSWDGVLSAQRESVFAWSLGDAGQVLLVTAGAVALLAAVAYVGFLVLSRAVAGAFTAVYLLAGAAFLLPTRDLHLIALMLLALLALVIGLLARVRAGGRLLPTASAATARGVLFLPLLLLLGRSVWFYDVDAMFLALSLTGAFAALRYFSLILGKGWPRDVLELVSVPVALGAGVSLGVFIGEVHHAYTLVLPAGALLAGGLLFELSTRAGAFKRLYRWSAALVVALPILLNLLFLAGPAPALICLLAGLGLAVQGALSRQRLMLGLGVLLLLGGLARHAMQVIGLFDWGSWGALAALGVAAILISSVLERHGQRLRARLAVWKDELADWEL